MSQEAPAVAIAMAHVEAWSNHDFDTARIGLAPDVRVTATTTVPGIPATDLAGADADMTGLVAFAQGAVPGSPRLLASVGDERNALLTQTVRTSGMRGPASAGPRIELELAPFVIMTDQSPFIGSQEDAGCRSWPSRRRRLVESTS